MKTCAMIFGLVALAGAASGDYKGQPSSLLNGTGGGYSGGVFGERAVHVINIQGTPSMEGFGDPLNFVGNHFLGANAHITGIGWDVELQTVAAASYLSEMVVNFGRTSGGAVNLTVGIGDDNPGLMFYSSGGIVDIVGLGLDFNLDGDGLLRTEFFESFNDAVGSIDGLWKGGFLRIEYTVVPAPSAMALLGLGGLVATRRRR
jgi:hypothetical protein